MSSCAEFIKELSVNQINFTENEPLKNHSTFKVGGNAEIFIVPADLQQLSLARKLCKKYNIQCFILGKGSNVLFKDSGFKGAVILIGKQLSQITADANYITAQAGANLGDLCTFAKDKSLSGLEFAFGIPGCVGGAVFMNAGAYDGEMKDVISSVSYFDENNNLKTASLEQAQFGYRTSLFQNNDYCIVSATFCLKNGSKDEIAAKMQELAKRRADKQPLEMPSAGSAFKRPVGAFAGALIDQCGLKGAQIGGAAISDKHCGFIVNKGNATCEDVLALADMVCKKVFEETGYNLEKEIRVIG